MTSLRQPLLLLGLAWACSTGDPPAGSGGGDTGAVLDTVIGGVDVAKVDTTTVLDVPDTAVGTDLPPLECPGGFGCPCENGDECNDDYCIQGTDGFMCSRTCVGDCPGGFRCLLLFSTCPDCVSLCIPDITRTCAPCQTDADCLAGRCLEVAGGKACADQCSDEARCPDAYACVALGEAGDAADARFCRPLNGTCDCKAESAGVERPCTVQNAVGICAGVEICDPATGWVGCTAKAPIAEVCNGEDDDCDGPADDGIADVGGPCEKSAEGIGTCAGTWSCAGLAGLVCSAATPSAEVCNQLDDNCDGETDEAFRDAAGLLVHDAHCGACGDSCEGQIALGTAICTVKGGSPTCVVGECEPGLVAVSDTECGSLSEGLCDSCISAADCASWQSCTTVGAGTFCAIACTDPLDCPESFACTDGHCLRETGGCGIPGQACSYPWECEDLDACTEESCADSVCTSEAPGCDDGSVCTTDSCDPVTGCVQTPNPGGCSDGDACTLLDGCQDGSCVGTPKSCDDGLTCTTDSCAGGSCSNTPLAGTCLVDGACWNAGDFDPENGCRACLPAESTSAFTDKANGFPCDDGDACTSADQCQGGACAAGGEVDCGDGNPCTEDLCAFDVGCVYLPNTLPCNDGKFCTVSDACASSACGGQPRDCGFLTSGCSTGVCSEVKGACQTAPIPTGTGCNDGQACTQGDICIGGVCKGGGVGGCCATAADCGDGNPCTVDTCESGTGTCSNDAAAADGFGCNDGRYCTIGDLCEGGLCGGTSRDCSGKNGECVAGACDNAASLCVAAPKADGMACATDGNACTDDACDGGLCEHVQNTSLCSDGNPCTWQDACDNGTCGGVAYSCEDGRACTEDVCKGDGSCGNPVSAGACLIGGTCHDALEMDPASECRACVPGTSTLAFTALATGTECADDGNPCTSDACAGGLCAHPPTAAPCDDGSICTKADTCSGGSCAGAPYSCDDGLPCTVDACDGAGGCTHAVTVGACLIGTTCALAGATSPTSPCQRCVPETSASTWTNDSDGTVCSDGSACSAADVCKNGGVLRNARAMRRSEHLHR